MSAVELHDFILRCIGEYQAVAQTVTLHQPSQRDYLAEHIADELQRAGWVDRSAVIREAIQSVQDNPHFGDDPAHFVDHIARLYDHILSTGGNWTTTSAHRWLVAHVDPATSRHRARHALQHLAGLGYLTEDNVPGRRTYTPNYAKDGDR